jgi:hypothetical protein
LWTVRRKEVESWKRKIKKSLLQEPAESEVINLKTSIFADVETP